MTASDPAGELRSAAALMREQHGPEHVRHAFWSALADWLEAEADRAATGVWALHALSPGPLKLARTYLGTADD